MSVLLIAGLKCMLGTSHAAPWWLTVSMPMGKTDRQTDCCQTIILCFLLDAANTISSIMNFNISVWYSKHKNAVSTWGCSTRQRVCFSSMHHFYQLRCLWSRRCTHVQHLSTAFSTHSPYLLPACMHTRGLVARWTWTALSSVSPEALLIINLTPLQT